MVKNQFNFNLIFLSHNLIMYHNIDNPTQLYYNGTPLTFIDFDYYTGNYISIGDKVFKYKPQKLSLKYDIPNGSYLVKIIKSCYGKTFCFNDFAIYKGYKWNDSVDHFIVYSNICAVLKDQIISIYQYNTKELIRTIPLDYSEKLVDHIICTSEAYLFTIESNGQIFTKLCRIADGLITERSNDYKHLGDGLCYSYSMSNNPRLFFQHIDLSEIYDSDITYTVTELGDNHYAISWNEYHIIVNTNTNNTVFFDHPLNSNTRIETIKPKYGKKPKC